MLWRVLTPMPPAADASAHAPDPSPDRSPDLSAVWPSAPDPSAQTPRASGSRAVLPQELTVAASRFARTMARRADVGVSSVAWRLCSTLHRRGPLRLSEIAEAENVTRPTATTAVQRLEEAGLLSRHADPTDHRSSLIELTPAGLEALRRWTDALGEAARPLLADLSEQELDTLHRAAAVLQRLADAAEHDHTSATGG